MDPPRDGHAPRPAERDPPDIDAHELDDADYQSFSYEDCDRSTATTTTAASGDNGADEDTLDLEEVNRLATEEDYELVYFSKESRLISFEPATGAGIMGGEGGDENDNAKVRINVYWTTGTVGTCLSHPTRGKTRQLLRRGVGLRKLGKIFRNPRVRAGDNYYEMQDEGAPSPADIPPDNSHEIALLQETNQLLRKQLSDSQAVEITGPRGSPVYASGSFGEGRRIGGLWGVDLAMGSSKEDDVARSEMVVPISALEDIEIRLGGVLYASACSHEVRAQMDEQDWDGDARKEVLCHFGGPVTGVWLPLRIDGWPRNHWSSVRGREISRRRNDYRPNLDVYGALLDEVRGLYPRATLSFHRLSFFGECVKQVVDRLGLAAQATEKQEEEEMWNIANLIVATLRQAGNDDVGQMFMKRVNDVQMAAYMMLTMNNETNEAVEVEIPTLVQLQLDSQSTADFLSQVGSRYNISRLAGN